MVIAYVIWCLLNISSGRKEETNIQGIILVLFRPYCITVDGHQTLINQNTLKEH